MEIWHHGDCGRGVFGSIILHGDLVETKYLLGLGMGVGRGVFCCGDSVITIGGFSVGG